jgi:hypothetical protein
MIPSDITRRPGQSLVVSDELMATFEHGARVSEKALSAKTRKEYAGHWRAFEQWCERHGATALPTTWETAWAYLSARHKDGCSVATLQVIRAAITQKHRALPPKAEGRDLDLHNTYIRTLLQGARRQASEDGRRTNKATPFLVTDYLDLVKIIGTSTDLEDKRDLALLGLGLVRALRGPSELLALDYAAAGKGARGILVLNGDHGLVKLRISKTRQHGDGEDLRIEDGVALQAVRSWVAAAMLVPGRPLFRAIRKGEISDNRMSQRTLHEIIQRRAKQLVRWRSPLMSVAEAEQIAAGYSTHSLRRGALTSLGKDGATLAELLDLGRHSPKSASVVLGYVEPEHAGAKRMKQLGI